MATGPISTTPYDDVVRRIGGAVHRWKFDESSGNFTDSIGSLTLAVSGSFTYSQDGPLGGAVLFGASAKGQASGIGNLPDADEDRTFALVWQAVDTTKRAIYSYGTTGTRNWWTLFQNDGGTNLAAALWGDDQSFSAEGVGGIDIFATEWHLTIWRYASVTGQSSVIHDGRQLNTRTHPGDLTTSNANDFRVGQDTTGSNQFNGRIDDLVAFDKHLTRSECDRLWRAFGGKPE